MSMNFKDLVARAKTVAPGVLGGLPEGRAVVLLREVFRQIAAELESTEQGVVRVAGLGQFRIVQVEREVDGRKAVVKRIFFRPAQRKN